MAGKKRKQTGPAGNVKKRASFLKEQEWQYLERDGVTVSTWGIPEEFREAFSTIMVESRVRYQRIFGANSIGWIEFNVRKTNGLPLRLWTNGADRVFVTLSKMAQLQPPARSGARYLYGLPHELGHIVLYRSLINIGTLADGWGEGWAGYLASFLAVPYLYRKYGPDLWPHPYDYLASEGPGYFLKVFESVYEGHDSAFLDSVRTLHEVEQRLGRDGFGKFFRRLLKQPLRADGFRSEVEQELERVDRGCADAAERNAREARSARIRGARPAGDSEGCKGVQNGSGDG